jgi:glycine betaine/proline transport system substrate-binding protein
MNRFNLRGLTSNGRPRPVPGSSPIAELPKGRIRASAVGAALCALMLVTSCAQTESKAPAKGVDKDVSKALAGEGEVEFMISDGLTENALQSNLLTKVVNALGGKAKLLPVSDYAVMSTAMSKSDNMIRTDFWRWQAPDIWDKYVEKEKSIVEIGTSDYPGEEGWYVPTYVIKGDKKRGIKPMCPGLPDWKALNDCAQVFATAKTGKKGQYMEGAESWAPFYGDQQRIDNLDLNYKMVYAGSEPALMAELKRAYQRGEPWLGLMWRPNYATQVMDLTRIDFPAYSPKCWGTTYACQWPKTVIYTLGSAGLKEKHPAVWNIMQNYEMPSERLAEMQSYVVDDGMSFKDAAQKWMDENPDVWKAWAKS